MFNLNQRHFLVPFFWLNFLFLFSLNITKIFVKKFSEPYGIRKESGMIQLRKFS
jgi:hypothetical protein